MKNKNKTKQIYRHGSSKTQQNLTKKTIQSFPSTDGINKYMESSTELKIPQRKQRTDEQTHATKKKNSKFFTKIENLPAHLVLENSKSLPVFEKIITPTWASHKIASSEAFLSSPTRRLENVTCLLLAFSIFFISILPRPISPNPKPKKNPIDQNPENPPPPWLSPQIPTKKNSKFHYFWGANLGKRVKGIAKYREGEDRETWERVIWIPPMPREPQKRQLCMAIPSWIAWYFCYIWTPFFALFRFLRFVGWPPPLLCFQFLPFPTFGKRSPLPLLDDPFWVGG